MKEKVYLETTIVSYHAARPSRDLLAAARQQLTQDWWQTRSKYQLYTSALVILEASKGDPEAAARRLAAIAEIPLLQIDPTILKLAEKLTAARLVPEQYAEDAVHVAAATVHRMDFLLTWNCKHIANAHIRPRLVRTLEKAGYSCPVICTPEELLGDYLP